MCRNGLRSSIGRVRPTTTDAAIVEAHHKGAVGLVVCVCVCVRSRQKPSRTEGGTVHLINKKPRVGQFRVMQVKLLVFWNFLLNVMRIGHGMRDPRMVGLSFVQKNCHGVAVVREPGLSSEQITFDLTIGVGRPTRARFSRTCLLIACNALHP